MNRASDEAAYKLPHQLGEYLCTWHLPTEDGSTVDVQGNLSLEEGHWPTGFAYGDIPVDLDSKSTKFALSFSFPQRKEYERIAGTLTSGVQIELQNCTLTMWSPDQARLIGTAAVLSSEQFNADEPRTYRTVHLQIEDMHLLAAQKPLKAIEIPKESPYRYSATVNEQARVEWLDDEHSLRFGFNRTLKNLDFNEFRLLFSSVLTLESPQPLTAIEWYLEWVEPLRELLSVAFGEPKSVHYLLGSQTDFGFHAAKDQLFGWNITQQPQNTKSPDPRGPRTFIPLISEDVQLLQLLFKFKELDGIGHPLIQTYSTLAVTHDQHPRARVLLTLQALEGAHGHRTKEKWDERVRRHLEIRDSVLSKLQKIVGEADGEEQLTKQDLKFVKDKLAKSPPWGLADALTEVFKQLPGAVVEEFNKINLLCQIVDTIGTPNTSNIAQALVKIRNNLSHGNTSYPSNDLHELANILDRIVRYEFLHTVGLNKELALKILAKR